MTHTLNHVFEGCRCDVKDILTCVICGGTISLRRTSEQRHVDTCSERCYRRFLKLQRKLAPTS